MPQFWDRFEGLSIAGSYMLRRPLECGEDTALFLAAGCDEERAVVRLVRTGGAAAGQAALWRRIARLPHPHLLRILHIGELEMDGVPLAWAAMEYPEENLGEVLYDRALTAEEAGQALLAAAEALAHLHSHALVHGAVSPWSVVAAGDAVKISPAGAREAGPGGAAEDVRALGLTACEMLTRRVPEIAGGLPVLAPEDREAVAPFETFIRRALAGDSAARLAALLRGEPDSPQPAPIPAPEPPLPAPSALPRAPRRAIWALALAAALAALLLLAGRGRDSVPPPAPAPAPSAEPSPPPAAAPEPRPSPFGAATRQWRVVAYTYSSHGPADKKARAINARFPDLRAEVFTPRPGRAPYLVALGGRMSRDEAARLRHTARARGLPRDTYIRNYR